MGLNAGPDSRSRVLMANCVLLVTCPNPEVGERIARELVEKRLAACGNVTTPVTSVYRWQGKVQRESEVQLILKTRRILVNPCVRAIRELHPYEVPEIIALPIIGGLSDYLGWIESETSVVKRPRRASR